jgi:hypothetical protein
MFQMLRRSILGDQQQDLLPEALTLVLQHGALLQQHILANLVHL